jgi:hypothetical protein
MERLPGQHLYRVWNELTVEKKKCVLSQYTTEGLVITIGTMLRINTTTHQFRTVLTTISLGYHGIIIGQNDILCEVKMLQCI